MTQDSKAAVRTEIARTRAGFHGCVLHDEPLAPAEVAVPFLAAGRTRGERAVWLIPASADEEAAWRALAAEIPDWRPAREAGTLVVARAEEWFADPARLDGPEPDGRTAALRLVYDVARRTDPGTRCPPDSASARTTDLGALPVNDSEGDGAGAPPEPFVAHLAGLLRRRRACALAAYAGTAGEGARTAEMASVLYRHDFAIVPDASGWRFLRNRSDRSQPNRARHGGAGAPPGRDPEEGRRALETLMEHVPEGITIADAPDGTIRYLSRFGEELLGKPNQGLDTTAVLQRWQIFEPDGVTPIAETDLPLVRALRAGEIVREREIVQVNAEGRRLTLVCNAAPVRDASGRIIAAVVTWREVSAQRAAQAEAERSRRWLERIASTTPDVIYVLDLRTNRNVYVNRSIREVLGHSPDELQRSPDALRTLVEPVDLPAALRFYREMAGAQPGEVRLFTHRSRHRNGTVRWMENRVSPFTWDAAGRLREVIGLARDVTERRRADEVVRRERAFLRKVIDASPAMIFAKDREGRFILANEALSRIYGAPVEEILGRTDAHFNPHDAEVERFLRDDRAVMDERRGRRIREEALTGADGEVRWFSTVKVPLVSDDGTCDQVLGVATDITERKRAEEAREQLVARLRAAAADADRNRAQFEAVFHSINDGVVVFDAEGQVILLNEAEARLVGYADPEEMKRELAYFTRTFELAPPGGPPLAVRDWPVSRVLRGESVHDEVLHGRRLDTGQEWYFSFSGEPVPDERGRPALAVIVTRDVTERQRQESIREEFIGLVSHEMRTPLTVVIGALDTVLTEGLRLPPDVARDLVQDAYYEAKDLSDILENLLELSRARTSRLQISPELVDVAAVAAKVARRLEEQGPHRFTLEMPAGAAVCLADPLRVERILYNLAHNATKYSEPGTPIRIEARREEDALVVGVHDRGIGIAAEEQERIFEPFHRMPAAGHATAVSGVGLGLTVCRRLVEAHGGRLWVESSPGHGSSFRFTLPFSASGAPGRSRANRTSGRAGARRTDAAGPDNR